MIDFRFVFNENEQAFTYLDLQIGKRDSVPTDWSQTTKTKNGLASWEWFGGRISLAGPHLFQMALQLASHEGMVSF